ncbi:MAG: hypothetical protein AUJ98_03585 [Bacteroidetes bacterium CG2_30_33_31]|nr:MAG: hypothetical protein AUJ98_03585 [Bacteroidetes bacterium CG2_30_33_31]
MQKSVVKLIWSKNKKTSIIMSFFGLLMGYFIVLISFNVYFIVTGAIDRDDNLFSKDYIVINKKVSILNTIKFSSTDFTKEELQDINSQPFVEKSSAFVSNTFKIGAYSNQSQNIPSFYTELFFQAIPDNFIDVSDSRWNWNEHKDEIPIIFPGDYLKLYNFGFAQSQGLPQISDKIIGKVAFNVAIEGNGKKKVFKARIIGLTDKLNSILVPLDFMNWANKEFGNSAISLRTSMLLIETNNPSDPKIFKYLSAKNYETNKERIKNSKTTLFLNLLFGLAISIGLIITTLSLLLFILSFHLLIAKSSNEISLLYNIGYSFRQLLRYYLVVILAILVLLNIFAYILIMVSNQYIIEYFASAGFSFASPNLIYNLFVGLIITSLIFLINIISLRHQLRRIK